VVQDGGKPDKAIYGQVSFQCLDAVKNNFYIFAILPNAFRAAPGPAVSLHCSNVLDRSSAADNCCESCLAASIPAAKIL